MRALVYHGPGRMAWDEVADPEISDITITTGLMDGGSTPILMRLIGNGQLDAARFVTHRFGLDNFEQAYDVFGDTASGALKVVLTREEE